MAPDMGRRELALARLNPRSAFEIADMVAGGPAASTLMGRAPKEATREVGLEVDEAPEGGPRSKIAKISARAGSLDRIQRFGATAGRANGIRSREPSFKAVGSGIRFWGNFCELTAREHFSPSDEEVLAWSAYFSAGRTFRAYLPRLGEARILLGRSLEWKTKPAMQAARSLARAGGRVHGPKPAVLKAHPLKLRAK